MKKSSGKGNGPLMKLVRGIYNSIVFTRQQLALDEALNRLDNTLEEIIRYHNTKPAANSKDIKKSRAALNNKK